MDFFIIRCILGSSFFFLFFVKNEFNFKRDYFNNVKLFFLQRIIILFDLGKGLYIVYNDSNISRNIFNKDRLRESSFDGKIIFTMKRKRKKG